MKIFLLGLPGSGKSTLGKELSKHLGVVFVDLDHEIEKAEQVTIQEIFQKRKEDYFRRAEATQLRNWCEGKIDFVMATGGGVPVFFDNLPLMNRSGKTIFLDVPANEISKRLKATNLSDRPLFEKVHPENLKDQIEFMRSQRISFYRQAHLTFTGKAITSKEILDNLRREIQT